MKFLLFLFFLNGFLLIQGKDHSDLLEVLFDSNLNDQLDVFPFTLDKYQQNSNQIESNQAGMIKLMIQSTSLIVENHVFYILDKTAKTNYIEQMASLIEKVIVYEEIFNKKILR